MLLTPFVIWMILHLKSFTSEWANGPDYFSVNIKNFFNTVDILKIDEVRWNAFGPEKEDFLSRIYYNKGYYLIAKLFDYLSFLSPRLYFQAGDGRIFSPRSVEPIASVAFPLFILGIIKLIKEKRLNVILFALVFSFIAFILGQRSFAFLFPVGIIYIFISSKLLNIKMNGYKIGLVVYSFYLLGRMIWLGV